MVCTQLRLRRVGIVVALLLPLLILLQSMGPADAQFPQPPGPPIGQPPGMPRPPFGPMGPPIGPKMPGGPIGPKMPGGPLKIVHDWRCSNCKNIIATTTTPLPPNIDTCPRCGVRFINGGKAFLNPPPTLPQPGMPQPGMPQPGMPQPGMPQPGLPPEFAPPPVQPPMPQPPPAPLPANPVGAPPADPVALLPPALPAPPAAQCRWCSGDVTPGNSYCFKCKMMGVGVVVGGTVVMVAAAAFCAVVVFALMRSGTR
jgi:hypothetical protein